MASALWHGFADMGAVEKNGAFVVSRGEGAYIWDREGTRYLDATAGLWFTNVGHGRTEIADAVAAQLSKIAHFSNFGDFVPETTQVVGGHRAGCREQDLLHLGWFGFGGHCGEAGSPVLARGGAAGEDDHRRTPEGVSRNARCRNGSGGYSGEP